MLLKFTCFILLTRKLELKVIARPLDVSDIILKIKVVCVSVKLVKRVEDSSCSSCSSFLFLYSTYGNIRTHLLLQT